MEDSQNQLKSSIREGREPLVFVMIVTLLTFSITFLAWLTIWLKVI